MPEKKVEQKPEPRRTRRKSDPILGDALRSSTGCRESSNLLRAFSLHQGIFFVFFVVQS
jgi:hypothetical protein